MNKKEFNYFHQKVKAIVENNLDNPNFDITSLSKSIGISRSQIYRKIKKSTGLSIASYIKSIRLEKGKQLIQTTDWTISEIAKEVGFNSTSYFSHSFNQKFGQPPANIRK